jgi:phosphate transport system substrate-binding protein
MNKLQKGIANSLTIENLRDIYIGKIDNWKALSGSDLPIGLFSSPADDSGTMQFFINDILGGQCFSNSIKFIPIPTQAIKQGSKTPGGIYFASAAVVVPQCSIKTLPFAREPSQFVSPYRGSASC